MTNEQILQWAARVNYAHLNIDSACCIRYGRMRWEQRLPELTAEQRAALIAKIEHWDARLAKERAS
jgi:hypothetical protein